MIDEILVHAWRTADTLHLVYAPNGEITALIVPEPQPSGRTDGLWQHTCFEAFVTAKEGYYEFNFSPSTQWAAYRFHRYREGMAPAEVGPPAIVWSAGERKAELDVKLQLPPDATGPIGLSAVMETQDGGKSYWALAHPPGKPDFHAAACFVAELPPAS